MWGAWGPTGGVGGGYGHPHIPPVMLTSHPHLPLSGQDVSGVDVLTHVPNIMLTYVFPVYHSIPYILIYYHDGTYMYTTR